MNIPSTYIRKDYRNNWSATTEALISGDLQLKISTTKNFNGQLVTSASVGRVNGDFVSHVVYQDFYIMLNCEKHSRITSKVVEAQHIFHDWNEIKTKALEFYHLI